MASWCLSGVLDCITASCGCVLPPPQVTEPVECKPLVALTFSSPQVGAADPPSLGTLTCALDIGRALLKEQVGWVGHTRRGVSPVISCYMPFVQVERGSPSNCRLASRTAYSMRGACSAVPRPTPPPGSSCQCWSTLSCSCCRRAPVAWHTPLQPWREDDRSCWLESWPANW